MDGARHVIKRVLKPSFLVLDGTLRHGEHYPTVPEYIIIHMGYKMLCAYSKCVLYLFCLLMFIE
jgi:hypothetical protein